VPEVNAHRLKEYTNRGIIANPNCSTIQLVVALKPIYDAVGVTRINVATYQAVSGTGKEAIDELNSQTRAVFEPGAKIEAKVYPKQIAFNALPHIDVFLENGYTKEEMKMVWETKKILEDADILVNPTAVRIPVVYGHSEAVHIETKQKITAEKARQLMEEFEGIEVVDERKPGGYPTAVTEAAGHDMVYVGRIREDISHPNGLNFWVVADNVRKGAALNSVQIAELLVSSYI
jgi:aspartate-semialdehyde dehydrogenase